jgi:hypothetical protein
MDAAAVGAGTQRDEMIAAGMFAACRTAFCDRVRHSGRHDKSFFYLHHIFFVHNVTSLYLVIF